MSRRPDPERIYQAHRAGTLQRLIGEDALPDPTATWRACRSLSDRGDETQIAGQKPGRQGVQTLSPRPVPVSLVLVIWRLPAASGPTLKFTVP